MKFLRVLMSRLVNAYRRIMRPHCRGIGQVPVAVLVTGIILTVGLIGSVILWGGS
jgi:hypothetical protein